MFRKLLIVCAFALLFSCTPKAKPNNTAPAAPSQPETAAPSSAGTSPQEPVFQEIQGVITYNGLWLREEPDGNGVRQLDAGEIVTVIGEVLDESDGNIRLRPIRISDGTEGFVSAWFVIPDSIPAVIIGEAKIYSEPKLSKLTSIEPLTPMTIVAVSNESSKDGFIKISYKNSDDYARLDEYIKDGLISTDQKDIQASLLYSLAMAQDDPEMKFEFLSSAQEMQSPAFSELIGQESEADVPAEEETESVSE